MQNPHVRKLYKYRAFNERSLNMLRNEEIWAATPESFNDPFDCHLIPGESKNTSDLQHQLFQIFSDLYPPEEAKEQIREIKERNKNKPIKDIEDKNLAKHFEEAKQMGVFSLSEKRDQILMWSHYADYHQGFCIEFHRENHKHNFLSHFMCRPVIYEREYPNLNRALDACEINLYTKALEWKYEAEWRLVFKEGGKLFQNPSPITGIIFGLRMPEEHKIKLVDTIPNNKGITFYQAERRPGEFALVINKVEI